MLKYIIVNEFFFNCSIPNEIIFHFSFLDKLFSTKLEIKKYIYPQLIFVHGLQEEFSKKYTILYY